MKQSIARLSKLATKQQVFQYIDRCVAAPAWTPSDFSKPPATIKIENLSRNKLRELMELSGFEYDASQSYDSLLQAINKQVNFLNHLYNAEVAVEAQRNIVEPKEQSLGDLLHSIEQNTTEGEQRGSNVAAMAEGYESGFVVVKQ